MPPVLFPKKSPGLWRGTPPAIFPPILGLLGLGLAWRRAAAEFALGPQIPDAILGAVSLLFVFASIAYVAKLSRRPGVLLDDLKLLPGRAGLAAATMSVMLLALVMLRYAPAVALGLLWLGLALHLALAALVLRLIAAGPPEQRRVTPVWHLTFVGPILAPLSAIPLGFPTLSAAIFGITLGLALLIWAVSAQQFARASVPAPLRPLLAIHLGPASLFATVAASLDLPILAEGLGFAAFLLLLTLLLSARWLTAAGFSALWGAFTFPMAAAASAFLALAGITANDGWRLIGLVMLLAASAAIPVIAFRVMQAWARGQLGPKTAAAVA